MIIKNLKRLKNAFVRHKNLYIYNYRIKKSSVKIKKFHNKYNGERCFIIGNGPSLQAQDLEKLKGEKCFGTHRIYEIFNKTSWRPTFYCAQDSKLINESFEAINKNDMGEKFIAICKGIKYKKIKNANYVNIVLKNFFPELPPFSEDLLKGIYEGFTVTYMCFQLAVYMGFKEIYLLGVDHNYSMVLLPNGQIKENNLIKDHFSDNDNLSNIPQLFKSSLAYVAAEKYANEHSVKIFNATRGGKLEAFERIDFDEIF